jgi:hypothetical protein
MRRSSRIWSGGSVPPTAQRATGTRAAFAADAAGVAEEPNAAWLVFLEVLAAEPEALARMRRTRLIFEQMLSASFGDAPHGVTLPPHAR